jgi:chromosome segregation ATPase
MTDIDSLKENIRLLAQDVYERNITIMTNETRIKQLEAEVEQLISEHTHMGKMLAKTITDRHNACGEVERLKAIIKTDCEYEQEIRSLACNILSEFQVYGDSYGVPTLVDVVELLIEALKAQEVKG